MTRFPAGSSLNFLGVVFSSTFPKLVAFVGSANQPPCNSCEQRGPIMMKNSTREFECLLGKAALSFRCAPARLGGRMTSVV
jgi:hypothetical protein